MDLIFMMLALGLLYLVLQIVGRMIAQRRCPDDDDLRNFFMQRLREKEKARITSHLGICEKCQDRLHELTRNQGDIEDHLVEK